MADDGDISRRYRELPREEPPRHLDDAIRAAARRAVGTRPAPLVVPTGRQRWYFPLAAAAIIVLAVAVTLHVEREQPGEELLTAPAEKPKADESLPAPQPERRRKTESADSRQLREAAPPPELQKVPEPAAPPQAAPAPPPPVAAAGRAEPRASAELRRSDQGARAGTSISAYALQSPEQWLQGIADLRRQGRHDEADKSLAEFRKRFPEYRISKELLGEIEKR
jgi:hypothetical protein